MNWLLSLLLLGVVAISGCSDDNNDNLAGHAVVYAGITQTDETGVILVEDPEDWLPCDPGNHGDDLPPSLLGPMPAFPNPTIGFCTLGFTLPRPEYVRLSIWQLGHSTKGPLSVGDAEHQISLLVDGMMVAGWHTVVFNGTDAQGYRLAPGIYRCRFETEDCISTGDIAIIAYPFDSERLTTMSAFADEHWSVDRLDAAYDHGYLDRPDANSDYTHRVGVGTDYFGIFGHENLPLWVSPVEDPVVFRESIAMWNQLVFGWNDFVDPREFNGSPDIVPSALGDVRVSGNREVFRGNQ